MGSAFFELHKDLPREGPGDRESLDWALSHVEIPKDGAILDAACGPGADIADLLEYVPGGRVTAIDRHRPFVEAASKACAGDDRVSIVEGDMGAPPSGPYDLIWCAGALYFLGVEAGLNAWRDLLSPSGAIAFSEPLFFVEDPSAAAKAFWGNHPTGHYDDVLGAVKAAGFEVTAYRKLPDAAWEAYYEPQEERIAMLRRTAGADLTKVLDEAEEEVSGWRKCRTETGYGQFVVVPSDSAV